ncbi:hypothetical protein HDE_00294 [Halotydeus destructor]|nr:hypothetical protein HDE_00294 [Halotydeus destructor]
MNENQQPRNEVNLHRYLLTKGRSGGGSKSGKMAMMNNGGLKNRDTNVSPPSKKAAMSKEGDGSTPAIVKRKQIIQRGRFLNSPTDVLSPCSQKLWRRPTAHGLESMPPVVPKLNLMAGIDEDEVSPVVVALDPIEESMDMD